MIESINVANVDSYRIFLLEENKEFIVSNKNELVNIPDVSLIVELINSDVTFPIYVEKGSAVNYEFDLNTLMLTASTNSNFSQGSEGWTADKGSLELLQGDDLKLSILPDSDGIILTRSKLTVSKTIVNPLSTVVPLELLGMQEGEFYYIRLKNLDTGTFSYTYYSYNDYVENEQTDPVLTYSDFSGDSTTYEIAILGKRNSGLSSWSRFLKYLLPISYAEQGSSILNHVKNSGYPPNKMVLLDSTVDNKNYGMITFPVGKFPSYYKCTESNSDCTDTLSDSKNYTAMIGNLPRDFCTNNQCQLKVKAGDRDELLNIAPDGRVVINHTIMDSTIFAGKTLAFLSIIKGGETKYIYNAEKSRYFMLIKRIEDYLPQSTNLYASRYNLPTLAEKLDGTADWISNTLDESFQKLMTFKYNYLTDSIDNQNGVLIKFNDMTSLSAQSIGSFKNIYGHINHNYGQGVDLRFSALGTVNEALYGGFYYGRTSLISSLKDAKMLHALVNNNLRVKKIVASFETNYEVPIWKGDRNIPSWEIVPAQLPTLSQDSEFGRYVNSTCLSDGRLMRNVVVSDHLDLRTVTSGFGHRNHFHLDFDLFHAILGGGGVGDISYQYVKATGENRYYLELNVLDEQDNTVDGVEFEAFYRLSSDSNKAFEAMPKEAMSGVPFFIQDNKIHGFDVGLKELYFVDGLHDYEIRVITTKGQASLNLTDKKCSSIDFKVDSLNLAEFHDLGSSEVFGNRLFAEGAVNARFFKGATWIDRSDDVFAEYGQIYTEAQAVGAQIRYYCGEKLEIVDMGTESVAAIPDLYYGVVDGYPSGSVFYISPPNQDFDFITLTGREPYSIKYVKKYEQLFCFYIGSYGGLYVSSETSANISCTGNEIIDLAYIGIEPLRASSLEYTDSDLDYIAITWLSEGIVGYYNLCEE